jgi:hypothetical protein
VTLLSKQQILNAVDMTTADVIVPEWGGTMRVRTLSGKERDQFEASLVVGAGKKRRPDMVNIRAKLVALCAIDEGGNRLFNESEIALLGAKSAAALDRVFTACQRLNGLSDEDVEQLEKNSGADPSDSSSSTSA